MGERKSARASEVAALRLGIDLGMSVIDTAEMYGDGGAEEVVAEAIHGQRSYVFVVTKVYPHNASREKLLKACERSLKRLRSDAIDLYLLHWRERTPPLQETVETFEKLRAAGKIKHQTSTSHIPAMAYSPVGHSGALLRNRTLKKIAQSHKATPAQIALAWVLRQLNVIAIPKASTESHVRENAASLKIKLTKEDLAELDREFPPPRSKKPLPML
jgi:diketogulonate reductase-like aldo/keto reductase